jgi:hypothetical protein
MARRLDPPHDRVMLTPDELLVIGLLERSLADDAASPGAAIPAEPYDSRPPDTLPPVRSHRWWRRFLGGVIPPE